MVAYTPSGALVLAALLAVLLAALLSGFLLARLAPSGMTRLPAWALLVLGTTGVERLCSGERPGVRMLALIAFGLLAMKAIVLVEERVRGLPPLFFGRWLAFTAGWVGMRPRLFAEARPDPLPGARALLERGTLRMFFGAGLIALARAAWLSTQSRVLASICLLAGLSFLLHFGLCNLLAGFWRSRGVPCDALFRAPLRSENLSEFWARRWNLAFSEMTSIAVYRPLSTPWGRGPALLAGFLVSGLLHEMAISLPVRAGFGLPLLYFAIQGGLVLLERQLAQTGHPVRGWGGRTWTLLWLVAPLPLLFHRPFLAGVLWPLVGIPP